jgi:hypothetical protein
MTGAQASRLLLFLISQLQAGRLRSSQETKSEL